MMRRVIKNPLVLAIRNAFWQQYLFKKNARYPLRNCCEKTAQ